MSQSSWKRREQRQMLPETSVQGARPSPATCIAFVSTELPRQAGVTGVMVLGPTRTAVSGVSTHLNQLFTSALGTEFGLTQFQVGSEGRTEGRAGMLWRMISSPIAFLMCVIRARPQIVHINTSFEPKGYWRDLVYLAIAKMMRRKVVYQVHGGSLPGEFFDGSRVLTSLLRAVLSWPDVVVLLAQNEMNAYRAFAPRARLARIPNAVSLQEVDLRAERYLADRPIEVVYLGRLARNKGVLETIEAVRILRDRGTEIRLTVAGEGPALRAVQMAIAAAMLTDRVRVIPPVFGPAKHDLWQRADIFAFPTYHREGLPYALLEAMAAGVVPVASPAGAIPDVMQEGIHGLFVPARAPNALADALERLARNRPLVHRLAMAARARVAQEYTVTRLAQQFAEIYRELANRASGTSKK